VVVADLMSPISWMCLLWHAQTKFYIGFRSLELVVVELVCDPSLKSKITPMGQGQLHVFPFYQLI
jgi:hypothetical protein